MSNIVFLYKKGVLPNIGGVSRITYTLADLFRRHNHRVWFVATKKGVDPEYDSNQLFFPDEDAVTENNIHFLNEFVVENKVDIIINQEAPDKLLTSLLGKFKQCKEEKRLRIINCYHTSVLTPAINYAHQVEYDLKKKGMSIVFKFLKGKVVRDWLVKMYIRHYRSIYRDAASIANYNIVLNKGQESELLRVLGSTFDTNIKVIPNCILIPETKEFISKEDSIIWCGKFTNRVKRPDIMLRVWKNVEDRFPEWRLIMVGDGPAYEEMMGLAYILGLKNVEFPGRTDSSPYFKKAKIACVTSTQESFSLVAVEAMYNTAPVVTFDSFTMAPELITDGVNGFLIEGFNLNVFQERLEQLMRNESMRQRMGENAKESIERFKPERVYETWKTIIEE